MSNSDDLKSKFSDTYSEHAKDLILADSSLKNVKNAIRLIEHKEPIKQSDFLPKFMENGASFPPYDLQDRKTKSNFFGVSFFNSKSNLLKAKQFIPSERNSESFVVSVNLSKEIGTSSEFDSSGHMNHFLFNPNANNEYPSTAKRIKVDMEDEDNE